MKTPKRYQNKPTPTMPEDSDPDWYVLNQWCARAKRKNRIKQLKNTIAKLSFENNIFKQTFIQNRAFFKRLKAICREPNRSTLHRLTDIDRELQIKLMATKDYERKEQK